jgi:hypothetical protein
VRVLTATSTTQGDRPDDYCFTTDGELVTLPVLECSCPDCGCERAFAGLDSLRATTTCAVADVEVDPAELHRAVARSLRVQGWLLASRAGDGLETADGPLSAIDRELVDDVVARMVAVAGAFPAGTVLARDHGGVLVRRSAPAAVP